LDSTFYERFKVFIASPGDVQTERQMAERVIQNVNNSCRDTLGILVDCLNWEHLPPLMPKPADGRIQDVIIEELVRSCNVFVLILHKRWGTTEPGHAQSNTEREVNTALDMLAEGRNIMLLSYFRDIDPDPDPGEQEQKVKELKKRLQKRGLWFRTYKDPEEFKDQLTHDLYHTILKFSVSTSKRRALMDFWQLGIAEGDIHPGLAIIYPPLDRAYMHQLDPDDIWLTRLIPHIVYEDYRAIQKMEKTLRLVGFKDFSAFTVPCVPRDIQDRNRVWVCLPRNRPGLAQLTQYEEEARFRFQPRRPHTEAKLYWRHQDRSDHFEIKSPLAKYLKEQRANSPGGEWRLEHGRIVAMDFAILARFSDRRESRPTVAGTLKDYFIAGIRGLGTWGAGWFIDRRYNAFRQYANMEDTTIQLLLEVTYCDDRILEVKDVSDEPESYFKKENRVRTIRKHIRELCQR
jgi:hypothetical protein